MRRSSLKARPAPLEWAYRIAAAAVVAVLAAFSVVSTLAYAVRGTAPASAHAIAPWDGRLGGLLAQSLSSSGEGGKSLQRAVSLAHDTLLREPTSVPALSAINIEKQLNGDRVGARRLLAYAQQLTRRDLQTQLWAIEDAVARDDIKGALVHYDEALRTSASAPETLFPILAAAIDEPSIRDGLVQTLRQSPPWGSSLVSYVAGNGIDPTSSSILLLALKRAKIPVSDEANAAVISRLLAANLFGAAWSHFHAIRPAATRTSSQDPHFSDMIAAPSPFDWNPIDVTGMTVSIRRSRTGGSASFEASSNFSGAFLQQTEFLPGGNYRLVGQIGEIDSAGARTLYWTVACSGGRQIARIPLQVDGEGRFAGLFTVPAECPLQLLALNATSTTGVGLLAGELRFARIAPAVDRSANTVDQRS